MKSNGRNFVDLLNSLIDDYIETGEEMFLLLAERLCKCYEIKV